MSFLGIGPVEIMVIMAVALIAFGPQRLPELARHIAKAMKMFKDAGREIQSQLDQVDWEIKSQKPASQKKPPAISYDDTPDDEDYDFESEYHYGESDDEKSGSYSDTGEEPLDEHEAAYSSHSGNGSGNVDTESEPYEINEPADPAKVNDAQRYSREMDD